jgi:ferric-dicitrate binding protein FerR (iron transport regulator)
MVALLSGKISVTDHRHPGANLILQPGESVGSGGPVDTALHVSQTSRLTNPPQAWADHKIMASGMTVADIIANYEDTYGYHIVLGNPAQAVKRIDGTLSLESEEGVVYSLANILNAYIHREGKTIYLQPK